MLNFKSMFDTFIFNGLRWQAVNTTNKTSKPEKVFFRIILNYLNYMHMNGLL